MILPCIDGDTPFPKVETALKEPDGLLCFGGDLTVQRLFDAYRNGIFPWYSAGEPILWWSPWQRMVLPPEQLHVSKSLKKALKKAQPKFYINRDFVTVIKHCATIPRADRGTWIHEEMIIAYQNLFAAGHGFCIEAEVNGQLVGGMYGVALEHLFCGESMFSLQTNGSKFAMFGLCQYMLEHDIRLLDCQIHNPHLEFMGARIIPRIDFQSYLPQLS